MFFDDCSSKTRCSLYLTELVLDGKLYLHLVDKSVYDGSTLAW